MKTFQIAIGASIAGLLTGCATHESHSVQTTELQNLSAAYQKEAAPFKALSVSCSIFDGAQTTALPDFTVRRGSPAGTSKQVQAKVPDGYKMPEIQANKANGAFPVTPSTPKGFRDVDIGWVVDAAVSFDNGFAVLAGTLTERKLGSEIRSEGVPFRPIVSPSKDILGRKTSYTLTENKASYPAIQTAQYPISIAYHATQPESFRIFLDDSRASYADFTISPIH